MKEIHLEKFPAKTISAEGVTRLGISVFQHGILTGEVLRVFRTLRRWKKLDALLPESVVSLGAIHDIGKVNPIFLYRILTNVEEEVRQNWETSTDFDYSILDGNEWVAHEALSVAVLCDLKADRTLAREVVGKHHDRDWKPILGNAAYLGGPNWQRARLQLALKILSELGETTQWPRLEGDVSEKRTIRKLWAGVLILSDWIASRRACSYSPGCERELADRLLQEAGFESSAPILTSDFVDLFGYVPRTLQANVRRLYAGPGLYVLEAPTGYGKTEAALSLAALAIEQGDADGLYFALPTQLTSDRMVGRVQKFVSKLYGEEKTVRLLHSGARTRRIRMGNDAAVGMDWFRPNRQALLAPFAVGTVDQALLASLPVRFSALRLAGLAGKVVIFDEIHSYDAYTSELIGKLLQDLRAIKAVVIILSATLTDATLARILGDESDLWRPYHSALRCTVKTDHLSVHEWPIEPGDHHPVRLHLSKSEDSVLEEVVKRVQRGERVLWVENTVRKAQEIAHHLEELNLSCGLLHAKYRPVDRRERETRWTNLYGKAGHALRGSAPGSVLIGTQVLEQSLDLDADFLVTRLAPFDMLVQRIGRLWRHAETPRPDDCICAEAIVLAEEADQSECPFPSRIYYPYVLQRTYEVLQSLPHDQVLDFPNVVRELLSRVYEERDESQNSVLQKLKESMESDRKGRIAAAESAQTIRQTDNAEPITRYVDLPSYEVLVIHHAEWNEMPISEGEWAIWAEDRILRSNRIFHGTTCSTWDGWPKELQTFLQRSKRFANVPLRVWKDDCLEDPQTHQVDGQYSLTYGLWFACDVT